MLIFSFMTYGLRAYYVKHDLQLRKRRRKVMGVIIAVNIVLIYNRIKLQRIFIFKLNIAHNTFSVFHIRNIILNMGKSS